MNSRFLSLTFDATVSFQNSLNLRSMLVLGIWFFVSFPGKNHSELAQSGSLFSHSRYSLHSSLKSSGMNTMRSLFPLVWCNVKEPLARLIYCFFKVQASLLRRPQQ